MEACLSFSDSTLDQFEAADASVLNALPFAVVGLDPEGLVTVYNEAEQKLAGLSAGTVMGRHFFHSVAPCMNNFMVAQRFEDEPMLNETLNYVLTFRMRPKAVRLRLLQEPNHHCRYILIQI